MGSPGTPRRTCIGCGTVRPQAALLRYRRAAGGLVPDLDRAGGGRGAYTCPDPSCIGRAVARRAFARVLRGDVGRVTVEGLVEAVAEAVRGKVSRLLGLGRRARQIAAGHEAAERALKAGEAALLLVASDAGVAEAKRWERLAARRGVPMVAPLARAALGAAVGMVPRAVVAVTDPHLARGVLDVLSKQVPAPPRRGEGKG